ncbi:MAG TPA: Gfo/Idh/MocA family oxidoreductase [Blastocatellia bacterium]|nr:Gfo/Idh/MocA family oxidoreductase [Blastocatellia bacterium]
MSENEAKMNRREFVRQTSIATALFATAGMSAKSYGRILGANDRIRLGGIGPGDRGAGRLTAAQKLGAEIVALADVNKGMLDRALKLIATPVDKTYVDYNDLLARRDIDGVIIATPDHLHHDCLLAAVKAGKDVYIEKPLSRTIEEGENMVAAVRATKQIVQVGNQRRSGDHFKKARDIVASGGIGEIRFVRIWDFRYRPVDPYIKRSKDQTLFAPELIDWQRFLGHAPRRPYDPKRASGWRWFWDYAGGLMTDIGPHWLDVAMWITGSDGPRSVSCNGGRYQNTDWETPDNVHAIFDCGTFAIVFMVQFMNGQEYDGAAFYGLEGSIIQENNRNLMVRYDAKRKEIESWPVRDESQAHMQNFLDCMRSRQQPNSPVELANRVLVGAHLANESFRTGRRVQWDPVKWKHA